MGGGNAIKEKAKGFFDKFKDNDRPPVPPKQSAESPDRLAQAFDRLQIQHPSPGGSSNPFNSPNGPRPFGSSTTVTRTTRSSVSITVPDNANETFVGGFHPIPSLSTQSPPRLASGSYTNHNLFPPGPLPRPPAMPVPYGPIPTSSMSFTMQHALGLPSPDFRMGSRSAPDLPGDAGISMPDPHQDSVSTRKSRADPPRRPQGVVAPEPSLLVPPTKVLGGLSDRVPHRVPAITTQVNRQRSASTPPSPVTTSGRQRPLPLDHERCSGIVKKTNERCKRPAKPSWAVQCIFGDDAELVRDLEKFCYQHEKEVLIPSGFYAKRKNSGTRASEWVEFVDWIPPYLHADTQAALRVEMEKLRSSSDTEGFIYTFEIREPTKSGKREPTIKLKVGRTTNVVNRLQQWGNQCGSKEQVLRGWYPGVVEADETSAEGGRSMMKGRIRANGPGVWCHRLERLIHLELADLAVNGVYLTDGWKAFDKGKGKGEKQQALLSKFAPASSRSNSSSSSSAKKKAQSKPAFSLGKGNAGNTPCPDCGSLHKEIFEFRRVEGGSYKDREWEDIVEKVVVGWGEFVKMYV